MNVILVNLEIERKHLPKHLTHALFFNSKAKPEHKNNNQYTPQIFWKLFLVSLKQYIKKVAYYHLTSLFNIVYRK